MYQYIWDPETGGLLLTTDQSKFSKEPRPVYYKELDLLGFDAYWKYPKDDSAPLMWAEANNYIYRGRTVAHTKGGKLYTRPDIVIVDDPEPNGKELRFVNIADMCNRNSAILENLAQETIQTTYNVYREYKDKIDLFYAAFSGGKDSVVALDIVQRALPHNDFKVLFGDTRMEFPDTYDTIDRVEKECADNGIEFIRSYSLLSPEETWSQIGPPAQKMRWCCSVHKTTPQILLLRKLMDNPHFRGMAFMGVRAEESTARSKYEQLSYGKKHRGQYDFYPILEWSSAEVFLYIFSHHLTLNETYKKGNSRAGCLACPMEADKNSWFKNECYCDGADKTKTTAFFHKLILDTTVAYNMPSQNQKEFLEFGVWKSRHNGKKLRSPQEKYTDDNSNGTFTVTIKTDSDAWKEWIKTIGNAVFLPNDLVLLNYNNVNYTIDYSHHDGEQTFKLCGLTNKQDEIYLVALLKNVFRKTAYCIFCQFCEANCPNGFIHMENGKISIDDHCVKCQMCHKPDKGCLVASSHIMPKEKRTMSKSIDRYKNMGIRYPWVVDYFAKQDAFWEDNELGTMMVTALRAFLADSEVSTGDKITNFGKIIARLKINNPDAWALMLCNLATTSQFRWWIENIEFGQIYTEDQLKLMLDDEVKSENSIKNIVSGYKNIFYTNPILSNSIGLGVCECEEKGRNIYLKSVVRHAWDDPTPEVVLYGLYRFAEACDDYYQFSLETLLDDSIERDGVSPTRIFGLDRDTMIRILNGLANRYPEFISASFVLDLDSITLQSDKTSADVLALF